MYYCHVGSPLGDLLVAGDDEGLRYLSFPDGKMRLDPEPEWIFNEQPFKAAKTQLDEYFRGERTQFELRLQPSGTDFQRQVLDELLKIPYGETTSYGEIAERIGRPKAVRAVGAANGRNPLPILIPCHRVVGSSGDLTGFGGGLDAKALLLRLEAEHSQRLFTLSGSA